MRFHYRTMLCWCTLLSGLLLAVLGQGCVSTTVKIFDDHAAPLREQTLEGRGADKILLLPVQGFISSGENPYAPVSRPSVVQEVTSHLDLAATDPQVKAVVLMVDSSGGTVTGSDILYREIERFKTRRQVPVVACLMEMAASGAYYAALAADRIVAHPTTVTGSVGTVFLQPRLEGLMGKIGVEVEVYKSGTHKDMGAFFRNATREEQVLFQSLIDDLNSRFLDLVRTRRSLSETAMTTVSDARVFTARQAMAMGLVDEIGDVRSALARTRDMAGLPADCRIVAYRRTERANDNIYNSATSESPSSRGSLGLDLSSFLPRTGFYYLWTPRY